MVHPRLCFDQARLLLCLLKPQQHVHQCQQCIAAKQGAVSNAYEGIVAAEAPLYADSHWHWQLLCVLPMPMTLPALKQQVIPVSRERAL